MKIYPGVAGSLDLIASKRCAGLLNGEKGRHMEIDYKSAKITVDIKDSKVGTSISNDGTHAALHLTRNAGPVIAGDKTASDVDISAINIVASVDVHLSPGDHLKPGDDIPNLKFGFIQLVANMQAYTSYAGRTSNDGFMASNLAAPPAVPKEFAYTFNLDCAPESYEAGGAGMPFYNLRKQVVFPKMNQKGHLVPGVSSVQNEMDDHPSRRTKVGYLNIKTNKSNFLAEMIADFYFITAFVVRDEQSRKITPLAYVTWKTIWKAKYHWIQGNCLPYPIEGTFDVDKPIQGPPKEGTWGRTASSLLAKMTSPTTDPSKTANLLDSAAYKSLTNHPAWWNLDYLEQWPASFPSTNFWMDR